MKNKGKLTDNEKANILEILKTRFLKHMNRHQNLDWNQVQSKLELNLAKLFSLQQMELTGGEPDVVGFDSISNEYIFMDCSAESPSGRRSLCYDQLALDSRKENKPLSSVQTMADEMGVELLTEQDYRNLQQLGIFDAKTSSWIKTPNEIRVLGGAIFADFRYNQVFIYHNGASSYYAARGFRALIKI